MRRATLGTFVLGLLVPITAFAFPFGGQVQTAIPCVNVVIFAAVGPPIGGLYLWTTATQTYSFGPPSHPGQWIMGLSGVPYFCLVTIVPLVTIPGITISMMASSQ